MQHWTTRRRASLMIHTVVVLIPLIFGTTSALFFWYSLFHSWWVAAPMVAVIDILALLGLILFICRIESPFTVLRHALPFVSIIPLGIELWQLLIAHNAWYVAAPITLLATAVLVGVAWRCYVTIERLFVDPDVAAAERLEEQATAARQRMTQQVAAMSTTLAALTEMQEMAVTAVQEWSQQPQLLIVQQTTVPALPGPAVSREQAKAYGARVGVSERTVWRRLEKGEVSAADIMNGSAEEGA